MVFYRKKFERDIQGNPTQNNGGKSEKFEEKFEEDKHRTERR